MTSLRFRPIASLLALSALAGCSLAPPYQRPETTGAMPATWKTVDGWRAANPDDGAPRPDWWTTFGDATLNGLVARANAQNQTLAQAAAAWRQATAATREARASLFPTVSANGSVTHTHSGATVRNATDGGTGAAVINGQSTDSYRVNVQASWQPDLFGSVTNTVRNARYTEQARLADIANARLAIQGELVTDYLSLRATDATIASLTATVDAYRRSLDIASNQYKAGIVAKTDVFQAESQLASAQSDLEGQARTRAQYEDAIAVLIGENPAGFRIASTGAVWTPQVPEAPVSLPSALVERRPDIAAAERAVAAANATIGINRAAFFPTVSLTGSGGFSNDSLSGLFSAGASLWSLGASVAQTLLDFGARGARVAQSRAAYDAAVANYRQVTLTAFQDVQDNLIAQQVLARQESYLRTASMAADQSETTLRNQYRAGIVVYTNVVTAQATALNARRALIQAQLDRQTAHVALVQALGGGWSSDVLTRGAEASGARSMPAARMQASRPSGE
ncbi:efflux transporter outer membrane subunit [Sphingomonas sp. TDK1]|uniref:efflux transporter outer membrane subunit n=1 Tax=Sphingomonas sp. TDK1 TaxID=453247 RepID=UPI0007D8D5E6|nr:efflux transporter outer membrane subunit [Sphingomonas sp. TDK1]OAN66192.1 RND transporter [Sphingomonas sp. TDK1]